MTPQEMIDKGIATNDVDLIKKGNILLKRQNEKANTRHDRVNVDDFKMQVRDTSKPRTFVDENGKEHTISRREPLNTKKISKFNMFKDDGILKKEDKQTKEEKEERVPTERMRPESKKIEVVCDVCEKETSWQLPIHTISVEGKRWVCDKCVKKRIGK